MKKVLFLINTLSGGGAEKILVDIVNNLDKSKYEIVLQTIMDEGVHKNSLNSNIRYKSIIKTKNALLKRIFAYFISFIMPPFMVYKLFIKDKYDIEVAFLEGIPTKLLQSSKCDNKIAWVHTDLVNNYGHEKTFKSIEQHADTYRKFDRIVCVSNTTRDAFKERFGFDDNTIVQYNFADKDLIQKKSEEEIFEVDKPNKFTLLTVGRLTCVKGYDRLVRVHKKLIEDGYDYHLWILGEGEQREELEEYIAKNKLEDSLTLIGFNSNPYKFMKNADAFVCASRAEGFPLVIVESLVCELPIVSTYCSGPNEILGDSEYGILVENSEDGLYNGIKVLLDDEKAYAHFRQKSKERANAFDKKTIITEIESILERK